MTSYIKVGIKPFEYTYNKYFEFIIPIDNGILKEIQEPIHDDSFLYSLPEATKIREINLERKIKINKSRKYWSDMLSKVISEKILNTLESNDTIDGYMKKDL
jgi:hypothetical protein